MSGRASAPSFHPDDTSVSTNPVPAAADHRKRWRLLFGSEPPRCADALVAQAVAWREQVVARGDVPAAVLRDLRIIADELAGARALRSGATGDGKPVRMAAAAATSPAQPWPVRADRAPRPARRRTTPAAAPPLPPASSQLVVGTRLVKMHGGVTHVVEVTAGGMLHEGVLYGSLSAVAKAITGTHWNGLLFFGLRRRKVYRKGPAHG